MHGTLRAILIAALATGGCYAETEPAYLSTTYAGPAQPALVDTDDGVQVIADYQEPIFFYNGFYWHNYGGNWYHARDYHRGWVSARGGVPGRIAGIRNPGRYRNFHGSRTSRR
jgi:hypothetical protein